MAAFSSATRVRAFLFTDIEGSTRLWQADADGMRAALGKHDVALRGVVAGAGGRVFKNVGDGVCAAFEDPAAAVAAALEGQRRLARLTAGVGGVVRARMAVHVGEAEARGGDWFGLGPTRTARLVAAAHGGQVLVSDAARALAEDRLPEGATLRDLGRHRLKDLEEPLGIFQLVHPDLADDFPPPRTLDAVRHNLPLQPSSFVGRERELASLAERLDRARLVTLVGPGGSGKTRLALQAAVARVDAEPDGVWVARLEALGEPDLVPSVVAGAIGLAESAGRDPESLASALRDRRLLVVLDNCEHLIEACAEVVGALLETCPDVRVMATSREPLAVPGETLVRVLPLPVPATGPDGENVEAVRRSDAVRLFVERARLVAPGFEVGEGNVEDVAELCRRLDGMPLALELAAARVAALGPGEVLRRLDARFRVLGEGARTARPRHRTLEAAIGWSHDLLDVEERCLFRRLAVFAGGWTLEAAEEICGGVDPDFAPEDVAGVLARLVEKSLVQVGDLEGEPRYGLLETVRAYARERLREEGEEETLLLRHHEWFAARAVGMESEFFGPRQAATHAWFRREMDNLRAALGWGLGRGDDPDSALRFAHAMYPYWFRHGGSDLRSEGIRWLERAVERSEDASLRARGFYMLHGLQRYLDRDRAGGYARACLEEARRSGVARRILGGLLAVGTSEMDAGNDPTPWYEEALEIGRGDPDAPVTIALNHAGEAARITGRFDRARELYGEALERARESGNAEEVGLFLGNLAHAELALGRVEEARALWEERIDSTPLETRDWANTLDGLAAVVAAEGDPERAARIVGAADRLFERDGTRRDRADEKVHRETVERLEQALGAERVEALRRAGWGDGVDAAVSRARSAAATGEGETGRGA